MADLGFVVPCLNEQASIASVVRDARLFADIVGLSVDVCVVDNGSTDDSVAQAEGAGARVINESIRGYGSAIRRGLAECKANWIVIADADGQHVLEDTSNLIAALKNGADLAVGRRRSYDPDRPASPWMNRSVGSPLLSFIASGISGMPYLDFHCGFRAITRDGLCRLSLQSTGMEFSSEMLIRAHQAGLRIVETDVRVRPRQDNSAHLRPFTDGFRHLREIVRCQWHLPSRARRQVPSIHQ